MTQANMPPPENPILGQDVAVVAQGTTAIMQLLQEQNAERNECPHHTTLQQFLAINPPRFSEAWYPLEADDWLAEIKKHFNANIVRPVDYVTFISFQLQGAAGSWYSTYKDNKGDTVITWDDFVRDFRDAHKYTKWLQQCASLSPASRPSTWLPTSTSPRTSLLCRLPSILHNNDHPNVNYSTSWCFYMFILLIRAWKKLSVNNEHLNRLNPNM